MTKDDNSSCPKGQEQFDFFSYETGGGAYHYDYRAEDGELFTTVRLTLIQARAERDLWLQDKAKRK